MFRRFFRVESLQSNAVHNCLLDSTKVSATVEALKRRVQERFPGSGLNAIAHRLVELAGKTPTRLDEIEKVSPRIKVASLAAATLVVVGASNVIVALHGDKLSASQLSEISATEALLQELVLIGVGVAFIAGWESRWKRRNALRGLREIRAFVHLVDMHQLTKDPHRATVSSLGDTDSSPRRDLTMDELGRYLDYCSEMLALASKLASMYAERHDDRVVLDTVNEIETLANGLAAKVWQKIALLGRVLKPEPIERVEA